MALTPVLEQAHSLTCLLKSQHFRVRFTTTSKAYHTSSTTPTCCGASLASVRTTPPFLCHTPTCQPIRKSGLAIIRRGCCSTSTPTGWATLSMYFAAPCFLSHAPTCLPIGETISTIIRICRTRGWCCWHGHWWHSHWWQSGWHRCWQRIGWCWWQCRATAMMYPAAPNLFGWNPSVFSSDGAIERITNRRRCC
jgi:hypothetical protein